MVVSLHLSNALSHAPSYLWMIHNHSGFVSSSLHVNRPPLRTPEEDRGRQRKTDVQCLDDYGSLHAAVQECNSAWWNFVWIKSFVSLMQFFLYCYILIHFAFLCSHISDIFFPIVCHHLQIVSSLCFIVLSHISQVCLCDVFIWTIKGFF